MTERLETRLAELSAFLAQGHAGDGVEEVLAHLRDDVADAMAGSRASAERCLRLVVVEGDRGTDPPSLLAFLDASTLVEDDARKREIAQAAQGVLEMLETLVATSGTHRALSRQHVAALCRSCQATARASPYNKVKAAALSVIVVLLERCPHLIAAAELEPKVYAEKLFYDLKFGKATQTAKGAMLEVLGSLAKAFPNEMESMARTLMEWIENALDQHFAAATPQFQMITGLFVALARFLVYERDRYENEADKRQKVYKYLHSTFAATVGGNLSRFQVSKAAQQFLAENAHAFRAEIAASAHTWFTFMKFCCTSENKTIRERASQCASNVLRVLNLFLLENKDDDRSSKKSLNRMLKDVLPCITNAGVGSADVLFAIQVLRAFAPTIHAYLGEQASVKIEDKLRSYGEAMMTMDARDTAKSWSLFSQFVKCASAFIREVHKTTLDDSYMGFLGDMLCHVMEAYPFCSWDTRWTIYKSFFALFDAVGKSTVVDTLIDRVVQHTLLLSLSSLSGPNTQVVLYHPETGNPVTELVYSYVDFWIALLGQRKPGASDLEKNVKSKASVAWYDQLRKLLDSLVKSMLDIVRSLDLSYSFEVRTSVSSSDFGGFKPTVPRDHSIMANLSELVERIFPKIDSSLLAVWVPLLLSTIVSRASTFPLVSSFYRIGAVLAETGDKISLFGSSEAKDEAHGKPSELIKAYTHFVRWTSSQLRFYQDELLVASSKLILSTPADLLDVDAVISALEATLSLGISYLPAAEIGVSALEKWHAQHPAQLSMMLAKVVPLLAPFLNQRESAMKKALPRKADIKVAVSTGDDISDYAKLQLRVLKFLGSVGGAASTIISRPPEKLSNQLGGATLSTEDLQLSLVLSDVTVILPVGALMLEIGELALNSTERRVKASASETFHALACYLCGKTATHPHTAGSKSVFYGLWRPVLGCVLRLATDPEKICRALFEPLLFQLLRWLSSNNKTFPFEYSDAVDQLITGLSDPSSATRAMSSKCIASILTSAVEAESLRPKSSEHVDDIFVRLFSLCRHPGAVQRSGAAMTISYFLRSLNQENVGVVKSHAMRCLVSLLSALRFSEHDANGDASGNFTSQIIITKAIQKIEREVSRSPELFKSSNGAEADQFSLSELTHWLFRHVSSREGTFRTVCRRMFVTFSRLVSGTSCKQWVVDFSESSPKQAISSIIAPVATLAPPQYSEQDDSGEHSWRVLDWLKQFSASVEAYTWLAMLLEGRADLIFTGGDGLSGAKSKRKRTHPESTGTNMEADETTIAAAISAFLKFSTGSLRNGSLDYEKREYAAYVEGTLAVCQLVSLALKSRDPAVAEVIDVEDSAVQASLTEKLLDVLMRDDASNEHTSEIKRCIGEITSSSSSWSHQLRRHAEMVADALDRDLLGSKFVDTQRILSVSSLFFELICIGVLPKDQASPYAKVFARAVDALFKLKVPLPDYYAPVMMAIKAASACGWQITDIFVDDRLRRQYGPMHNDVVRMIALLPVWRQCCSAIMSLAQTNTQVLSMLTSVLRLVSSGQAHKPHTMERGQFAREILSQLTGFVRQATAQHPNVRMLLDTLEHVLLIFEGCPRTFLDEFCGNQLPAICSALVELLASADLTFLAKADALRLASTVVSLSRSSASQQAVEATLLKALQNFMIAEFPIKSTDVKRGAKDFDVFRLLFVELLGIVERSASGVFLRLLYPCLREGDLHLFFADMKASLSRFCDAISLRTSEAARTDLGVQHTKMALQMLQDLTELLLDSHEDAFVRRTLFEEVFTPYAELLPPETLQAFFLSNYGTAQTTVLVELTRIASKAMEATSEANFTTAAAFMMLEILFRLVDPECIRGDMNEAFLGHRNGKGREFTMLVCKCANKVATQQHGGSSEAKRMVCVGAYSCLHTAVSRTQKQEKIFDQLLFLGSVWSNIVDCSREIHLKAMTEAFNVVPLTQYSPSTLVNRQRWSQKAVNPRKARSTGSLMSQSLDFFTASSLSQADPTDSATAILSTIDAAQEAYDGIELELDAISSHPCIPSLLRTLMEMKNQFGSTWQANTMPSWMKKLHDAVCEPSAHLNVRLFLVKLVLSVPGVFTPYAKLWLPPILDTVMETGLTADAEFHYLLRDVCYLILDTWDDVEIRPDSDDCSRFLNTLLALCPHPTSSVRVDNLVLVSRLMLRWKSFAKVDVGILVDFLFSEDPENGRMRSPKKMCGLQLVSALIAADLTTAIHHSSSVEAGRTLKEGILLAMKDPRAPVYTLAAEVGGVFLNSADGSSSLADICEIALDAHNHEDYQKFLAILRNVSLHEPKIIDSAMLNRLSFVLPKAVLVDSWSRHGIEAIENATRSEDVAGKVFAHVRAVLDRYINHHDEGVRFIALRVIANLLDKLPLPDLELVCEKVSAGGMGMLEAFASHDDPACRRAFYELVQRIFEKKALTGEFSARVRGTILRGFIDPDSEIRDQTLQFCSSSELLPSACGERLVELFEAFYAPDIVDSWSLYATNLLVGMSQRSASFNSALFADALGNSGFVDATIDTTWESKNQSMAPLFSLATDSSTMPIDSSSFPGQPTFGTSGTQASGSLGGSTQSQLVLSSIETTASQASQGELASGPQDKSRQLQQRRGRFVRQSDSGSSSEGSMFGRGDKAAHRRFFQDKHKLAKKALEASIHRQRKARSEHVALRRKYRVGEYPDIQISLRDILSPMMALCSVHHGTSSRAFGMLFASIVDGDDHFKTGDGLDTLLKGMSRTLTESKRSGTFVGCIQQAYFLCLMKNYELLERFHLPSKVLAESSLASGSYYSGELVLEELLIHTSSGGGQTLDLDSDADVAEQWDQLHKIVGTIQKRNFLLAIASKCSATPESRLALEARLAGNFPTAVASYAKAEGMLMSQMDMAGEDHCMAARLDSHRCFWERLGCLETLNSWSKLENELRQHELSDSNFVWKEETPYLEQGVGHKLRCGLGIKDIGTSTESDSSQRLSDFIKDAAKDPAKWQLLSSKFAVETILAYMKLEDASQARILVDGVYSSFLQRWQGTNALAIVPRLELMQMLSSTVQLDEVLSTVRNVEQHGGSRQGTAVQELQYISLVEKWVASSPGIGEGSISAWSQYYQVQDITNDFLWGHGSRSGILPDSAHGAFLRAKSIAMLGHANAALSNDIMALTSRYLKEYREICNVAQLPKVSVHMVEVFVSHILKLAERQLQLSTAETSSPESTKVAVRYFQTATKLFDNSDVLELMERIAPDEQAVMSSLEARTFGRAAKFYMMARLDQATSEEYFVRALDVFQSSCKTTVGHSTTGEPTVDEQLARPRLTFIEFLSDLLSDKSGAEWEQFVGKERIVQHLVDCVLDGMILGSQECATFFPQLCDLIAPFPTVTAAFCGKVLASVPLWTCLQWSAQLMALVNGPMGTAILPILEKMAGQYPVALYYDFKVSSSSAFKTETQRLEALLANPTMEKFVDALRLIHHPEIRLKEGLREVGKLLDDKKTDAARSKMEHVFLGCFSLESSTLGSKIGRYNREWARKGKREIEKIMGKNATNLTPKTVAAARDWIAKNFSVCPGKHGITRDMKARLGDFAEWLEEFDPSKHRLELPGQYTAHWGKPDPSQHTTILSFDAMMGVLPSKQLPKRLTLRCSNERDYTFLVKGGEDLRLDQRIEQLFGVMNHVLRVDPQCRNRQLSTRTYQVIPMTQDIGLIEWLDGTSTLKSVIETQLRQDERCAHLQSNKRQKLELFNTTAAKTYESFLLKQRGTSFGAKVIAPSSRDVETTFTQVQAQLPGDLLRRQLFRLSSDFDAFLAIRDRFLASLAVFNACSYILGIGDRHLDNFLLDLSDGRIVGIDFGVSFGAGASLLPVPELIPFRYTRQMDFVLQPYDGHNLIVQEMQLVFEALRSKKQVIESVLNVFLHEPLMDWQQTTTTFQSGIFAGDGEPSSLTSESVGETDSVDEPAAKEPRTSRAGRGRASASSSASSLSAHSSAPRVSTPATDANGDLWLPDVKIAIARRKLEGFAPHTLLKEELAQNIYLKAQLSKFHALVDSVGASNGSATSASGELTAGLTALAQAQELLKLATAPDILGRTYFGWMPWL